MTTTMPSLRIAEVEARLQAIEARDLAGPEVDEVFVYPYNTPTPQLTEAAWEGVIRLLDEYASIEAGAPTLVAFTPDSRRVAAWVVTALEERNTPFEVLAMKTVVDGSFARRLACALDALDATRPLTVLTFEAHTMSHGKQLRQALSDAGRDNAKVFRATSAGAEMFAQALAVGPDELHARNLALLSHVHAADRLHVTTPSGSDLHIELDHERFSWINNSGVWRPGSFVVLPAGEIATYPGSINGRLVADFAIHANVPMNIDTRLATTPVTLDIVDGFVVELHSDSREVAYLLCEWFGAPNGNRVGELGFGTNMGITSSVPENSHVNERNPGVHLGFGHHHQSADLVGYDTEIHVDMIASGGSVSCDGAAPIDLRGAITQVGEPSALEYQVQDVFSRK